MQSRRLIAPLLAVVGMVVAALAFAAGAQADPTPYPSGTGTAPSTTVSSTTPGVGGDFSAGGTGATPNGTVSGDLHTAVYHLATVKADSSGHWAVSTKLPDGVSGNHTFVVTDLTTGKTLASIALNIGGTTSGTGGVNSGGGGLAITGVAIVGLGTIGVALLVGGGLMLMAGRRRRVSA